MEIRVISENKTKYLDLLLLADEQEDMIFKYLDRGEMFALFDNGLKSVCVVTREDDGIYELKNIATYEKCHGQGYGGKLIAYLFEYYKDKCKTLYVGTGDVPWAIRFYERCGFELSHRVRNFFAENYDKPIYDSGIKLIDMVYLKKDFG
jgi:GNAT superfamily N-acetyltransferase